MASLTGRTRLVRKRKKRANTDTKRQRRTHGSTPKFPIHKDGKPSVQAKAD